MSTPTQVAAIGAQPLVGGFALAGAHVYAVDGADEVRAAWYGLPPTVGVVILTPSAADALGPDRLAPQAPLTVVMPR
jgi:vacuolar-type H+-ATPase subunit F/Vma7